MSTDHNKDVVRGFIQHVINERHTDAIDRYYAPGLVADIRLHSDELLDAFKDLHVEIDELIAEGDQAAARLTLTGHQTDEFAGMPPTGHEVIWTSFRFYRIADGLIVSTWGMQDRLGLLQQLGARLYGVGEVHWVGGAEAASEPPDRRR